MQEQIVNKIKDYIGSPEGLGKAKKSPPALGTSLVRRVLWRDGNLTEKKTTLEGYIGSGLSSVVYKGGCEGTEIVEKFTADIPPGNNKKSYAKKFMEGVFVLFRQAPFSYRTNFFAAMTNHYAHFVIEDASEFEFKECIIPKLLYTTYDEKSAGYIAAYEYVKGRPIRPGPEERLLKQTLSKWKNFISNQLGLWGIGRQCDARNINSPGNVFILDEDTKKMKLIDIIPGVLGGQIYLLPLECEYFIKGVSSGNFLPFGDAVNLTKLKKYQDQLIKNHPTFLEQFGKERLENFKNNCQMFEFFIKKWRDSEPALFRSPRRILEVFFKTDTIKSTIKTSITELEYSGAIMSETANILRTTANTQNRKTLFILRLEILGFRILNLIRNIPAYIKSTLIWLLKDMPLNLIKLLIGTLRSILKSYISSEYRKKIVREKVEQWIHRCETIDKSITEKEAQDLRHDLENRDILEIIQLAPLWTLAKIIKPPLVGTSANIVLFYMFIKSFNPYWLIPLFADGVIRFVIALIYTGFRHKTLLILSLIPTLGFVIPIPAQIMREAPYFSEFLLKKIIGTKLGSFLPGVDRHSFRVYFYVRIMNIPLFFLKIFNRI